MDIRISFQLIAIAGFFACLVLVAATRNKQKVFLCLSAYWAMAMALFWPAVFWGRCLVPGDILFANYPWKAIYGAMGIHNPLLSDAVDAYFPWMTALKNAYGQGVWPLWNFHAYGGAPLAANLGSAPFHPFNVFFLFMDVPNASTLFPFLRVILGATGVYLLLASWNLKYPAAFFGGLVYGFCGVHIVWLSNYPNTNITALAPWIFLFSDKVIRGRGWPWILGFAALSAVQFLGGHPETSFHLYAALFLFLVFRAIWQKRRGDATGIVLRRVLALAGAGCAALFMCAIQLLPFLEYLPQTTRYAEILLRGENLHTGLRFADAARLLAGTLFSPDFFGNPVHGNYWEFANYNEQNTHFTVTGLFFALLSLVLVRKKGDVPALNRFFWALGLAAICLAARLPLFFDLVVKLPGFKMAANHRLIFVFVLCFSISAAFGLSALLGLKKTIRPGQFAGVAVFLALGLAGMFFWDYGGLTWDQVQFRLDHLWAAVSVLAILGILPFFLKKFQISGTVLAHLAVLLAAAEIWIWAPDYNTFMAPVGIFPQTPMIRFLDRQPGLFRCSGINGTLRLGAEAVYGFEGLAGMDPMKTVRYERILTQINGTYHPVITPPLSGTDSAWLDFLNLKFMAANPKTVLDSSHWRLAYEGIDGRVFENRRVLPRYFWAKQVMGAANDQEAFEKANANLDALGEKVILESSGPDLPQAGRGWENPAPVPGVRGANRFEVKVEAQQPGVLVTSEPWYPGWRVEMDGKPGEILRANSAFMAVSVPENTRRLIFFFDPATFKTGLMISAAAWAVWAAAAFLICALRIWQRKRGNGPGNPA